jgi:hypothetical protein
MPVASRHPWPIGGLNFDVEDEQVATELVLERQLQRNALDSAVASAEKVRPGANQLRPAPCPWLACVSCQVLASRRSE